MSDLQNVRWLESARENFETALDNSDFATAKAVIGDMKDVGFISEAAYLERQLNEAPVY